MRFRMNTILTTLAIACMVCALNGITGPGGKAH